ncbi:M48 family metallopeptidase [uncultured Roseobacter sp.]|uniref:M48 family metallopeptidase n=1 Tax=uncultured Roseobacter sp. TaxID=114847 RepID=UPI002603E1F6|nr:M48 family metallopeptidase [uncultured Roseobacter sp.]
MSGAPSLRGLRGHAYAAQTSHRQPARLLLSQAAAGTKVEIQSEEQAIIGAALLSEVKIDTPLGRAPRKLTLPDGSVFETDDHGGFDQLLGRQRGAALHDLEAFRPRLVTFVVFCIAAVWMLWRYGLDVIVAVAVVLTPPVLIEQIDKGSLQSLDFAMAEPSKLSSEEKEKAKRIYDNLLATLPAAEKKQHSFDLLFRDIPDMGPNAFALPGGTVVLTDAFVEMFPEQDVVAGVLGHEIGHVVEEHGLKRFYRSLGLYMLIAFLAGDPGPILEDIVLEGNLLLSLSYSRSQEMSADEFGLRLAAEAGFDPAGLAQFFSKVQELYGGREPAQWMSLHPSSSERVEAIEALIEAL